MSAAATTIGPKPRRKPFQFARDRYTALMRYVSLHWPILWRLRPDLLLLPWLIGGAIILVVPQIFRPKWEQATIAAIAILPCIFFAVLWIYAVTRAGRLRETIRFANQPAFLVVVAGLASIAVWSPVIGYFCGAPNATYGILLPPADAAENLWTSLVYGVSLSLLVAVIAAAFMKMTLISSLALAAVATGIAVSTYVAAALALGLMNTLAGPNNGALSSIITFGVLAVPVVIWAIMMARDFVSGVQSRSTLILGLAAVAIAALAASFGMIGITDTKLESYPQVVAVTLGGLLAAEIFSRLLVRLSYLPRA